MTPEDMVSRLLYRDGLMLIIDKPAGVPVHKGPKGGHALEDDFDVLRFGLPRKPSLAHRLDRETSGCLVLGRHRKALAELSLLFRNGKVGKTYWAIVEGGPDAAEGRIDLPISKRDDDRGWWMRPDPNGLPSATTWKVMGRTKFLSGALDSALERSVSENSVQFTWLALEPLTGRTHQLRVHCAEMGWPIVGDNIYGNAPRHGGPPLQLHAREIAVPLYKNRPPIVATAPVPPQLRERLKACGWTGESPQLPPSPPGLVPDDRGRQ